MWFTEISHIAQISNDQLRQTDRKREEEKLHPFDMIHANVLKWKQSFVV